MSDNQWTVRSVVTDAGWCVNELRQAALWWPLKS